jgi:hypothetical protein
MDNEALEIRKTLLPELYAEIRWWRTVEQWSFTIFATVLVGALAWSTQNAGRIELGSLVFLTAALLTLWTTFTYYLDGNLRRSMTTRCILHSVQIMAGITEITQASERWSHKSDVIREHPGTLHFWCAATILSLLLWLDAWLLNPPGTINYEWLLYWIFLAISITGWAFAFKITWKMVFGEKSIVKVLQRH